MNYSKYYSNRLNDDKDDEYNSSNTGIIPILNINMGQ